MTRYYIIADTRSIVISISQKHQLTIYYYLRVSLSMSFNDKQINKLKQEFLALSLMGDSENGTITTTELEKLLREVQKRNNITERDIERILSNSDKDHSGSIEVHEFLEAIATKKDREIIIKAFTNRSAIMKQFSALDKAHKGYITKEEFKKSLEICTNSKISNEKMDTVMKSTDKNGDGKIDFEEFLAAMTI